MMADGGGCSTGRNDADDLACGPAAVWLWRLPTVLIVVGAFWPTLRFWLWIPAFLVAGIGCIANARRCGRVHCYVTGPLYLGAAGYLLLSLLARIPFHFGWFLGVVVAFSLLARLAERPLGRYRDPARPSGSSTVLK